MALWLLIGMLGWLLTGCPGAEERPLAREGNPVQIAREFKGQQGAFPMRGFLVVQRPEAWQALWNDRKAPEVDFNQYTVLVALMGQHPTAGNEIVITDVCAKSDLVTAYVTERCPARDEVVAQVVTYPYHMVVVPKITPPVTFIVDGVTAAPTPVAVQDTFIGSNCQAEQACTSVIRDAESWKTFWAQTFGSEVPPIDFTRFMAVPILMGKRQTTGYGISVPSIEMIDDRLQVNYAMRKPKSDQLVEEKSTSPYVIVIVPASPLAVAFTDLANKSAATHKAAIAKNTVTEKPELPAPTQDFPSPQPPEPAKQ